MKQDELWVPGWSVQIVFLARSSRSTRPRSGRDRRAEPRRSVSDVAIGERVRVLVREAGKQCRLALAAEYAVVRSANTALQCLDVH
jgi:hypothetical protein